MPVSFDTRLPVASGLFKLNKVAIDTDQPDDYDRVLRVMQGGAGLM
jgi:hypothetical protein